MGAKHEIRVTPVHLNGGLHGAVDVLLSGEGPAIGIFEISGLIDYLEVQGAPSLSNAVAWAGSRE